MQPRLKKLAVLSTIGMLILLLGGALVTKTESGDGCGSSWPLCNGKFIPDEITIELVIEASHRITTGAVAFMVVLLSYWSWKQIGHIRETKFLSLLAIAFIVIQSLIGAATVIWGQSDFFLALHFGISLISFAAVFVLTLLIFEVDKKLKSETIVLDKRMKIHTVGVTIYSLVVVYTGALVRHTESSMICGDWPLCNNNFISWPQNIYEWVQMGHRFLAGMIFIWILYIMTIAVKHYKAQPIIYYSWIFAFILAALQVTSGATIIFTGLNLFVSLLHTLFISCLFGILSYLILVVFRSQANQISIKKSENKEDEYTSQPLTSIKQ